MRHDDEKPKKPGAMPRWLRYLLGFFMAYMMFVAYRGEHVDGEEGHAQPKIEKYDEISKLVNIDRWQEIANPNRGRDTEMLDVVEGEFDGAACGQKVSVEIAGLQEDDLPDAQALAPVGAQEFIIGQGEMPWDRVVRGMKQGGKRKVQLGPRFFHEDAPADDLPYRFMMEMKEVSPNVEGGVGFSSTTLIKGEDLPISCGETGAFAFAVWKADNTEVYTSDPKKPTIHTLGSGDLGHGLDRGMVGMQLREIRRLMIPPAYQKSGGEIIFPKHELAIVEVMRLPYKKADDEANEAIAPEAESASPLPTEDPTP